MRSRQAEILSGFVGRLCDGQHQTKQTAYSLTLIFYVINCPYLLCSFCLSVCFNAVIYFYFFACFGV